MKVVIISMILYQTQSTDDCDDKSYKIDKNKDENKGNNSSFNETCENFDRISNINCGNANNGKFSSNIMC